MIRRPRRSLTAGLVALVLLALCVLVVVACVQLLLGQQPVVPFTGLNAYLATLSGTAPAFLVTAGVVALAGLVLLVVAVRPGTPTVLPLSSPEGTAGVDAGITRRSLDRALTDAATGVDGVTKASTKSRGRRAAVTAHASFGDRRELRERVRAAVTERLDAIGPARRTRVKVTVTGAKEA